MKNLKNMLGLLVAVVFTFVAVGTVNAAGNAKITVNADGNQTTSADFNAAYTAVKTAKSAVISLESDITTTSDLGTFSPDTFEVGNNGTEQAITIRLNGHTIDLDIVNIIVGEKGTLNIVGSGEIKKTKGTSALFVVKGGNLNVTNGVAITYSPTTPNGTSAVVYVNTSGSSTNKTNVVFSNDTTVESVKNGVIVKDSSLYSTITVAGDWNVTDGTFLSVTGTGNKNLHAPVINVISKGIYSAKGYAIDIEGYATVNVKGGTFTSSTGDVIVQGNKSVLNITGGNFTTETSGSYALNVSAIAATDSDAKNIQFYISAGTFESGEDSSSEDLISLPAINLSSEKIVNANAGHVTGGVFSTNVGNYVLSTSAANGQIPVATVSNTLTKGATTTTSNGKVTIKAGAAATDPDQKPGEDKPNTGDNQPNENPKTFDAIGSLVALAVSSLGVVGTATKKVLK